VSRNRVPLPDPPPRRRSSGRRAFLVAAAAVTLTATAACSGTGGTDGRGAANTGAPSGVGEQLTLAYPAAPNNLDPAKINQSAALFVTPAYDPLIRRASDGSLEPGLAESWEYVGTDNTVFELTLRSGVTFSDGAELDAAGVVAHLEYVQAAGGPQAGYLVGASFAAPEPMTVRITFGTPNPLAPDILTQDYVIGDVISPAALADPEQLAGSSAGAGPYTLDPEATVAGDHYTYVANPDYWNKDQVHYRKMVLRVITDPNTALNAIRTEQVDVTLGDYSTVEAAKSAGLQVAQVPFVFAGLAFLDRDGSLVPALGDVRVRQAINYALDRETISEALLGEYGLPTEQTGIPGTDDHVEADAGRYAYDPDKARELLAEAGYADGFDLTVLSTPPAGIGAMAQVVADQLSKVGIRVSLQTKDPNGYMSDLASGRYPAAAIGYGAQPTYIEGPGLFLPSAAVFNPRKSEDPELTALYATLAGASEDERPAAAQAVQHRLIEQAWFAPVVFSPVFYYAAPDLGGLAVTPQSPIPNLVDWYPTD
jgi:peptide/nickel transport system substrate-binding protein